MWQKIGLSKKWNNNHLSFIIYHWSHLFYVSLWRMAYAQNVTLIYYPSRQYTNILYFELYLNTTYAAHYVYCIVCIKNKYIYVNLNKRSALRRQGRDTNRNMKKFVYCRYGFLFINIRCLFQCSLEINLYCLTPKDKCWKTTELARNET